ncbi:TauD/TfdA dioxygenase family protein [Variovorax sp. VNK109]|jgi:alpha-ketoglutarate-dependent 2,4-dichlorophenoxyacetate dioxygenase|uniref:TauD/TfdA dioxygenase family protein n=1 Tax=Variovorax sp. VNK109 TaxID=3400919 RepID=UPI003C0046DF
MTLQLKPLHSQFAAEASGIDITQPLARKDIHAINAAMNQYAVLVWRNTPLSQQQQLAFAESFGPLDIGLKRIFKRAERMDDERLIDISNLNADGKVADRGTMKALSGFANQLWHSDSSFQDPRAAYSMLHAVAIPDWGGNTEFADLRAAYDALSQRTRDEIQGLSAEHYALHTRLLLGDEAYTEEQKRKMPPVTWPLVETHPGSGRKVLFVGVHATHIIGWPVAEGRMYLADLLEHATQREFVYAHQWQVGDLVMWDNRCTLHRGRRYDLSQRRDMRRATVMDVPEAMLHAA